MSDINFKPSTIWTGDNLKIMRQMNSACVDLIYLDPPFNSKADYAAPIGSEAAGAAFKDTWTLQDIDVTWIDLLEQKHGKLYRIIQASLTPSNKSYLAYMAVRLIEMYRILKPTGSLYLHCDPKMSHWLKILLDALFGSKNCLNEIVWHYEKWTNAATHFQKNHDIIFCYVKDKGHHVFNKIFSDTPAEHYQKGYHTNTIQSGESQLIVYDKQKAKHKIESGNYDKIIYRIGKTEVALPDVWSISILNSQSKERTGYPTQKPLKLLERIIEASSHKGDIIFDPFCGCATTLIAAQKLNRHWVGIDISPLASSLFDRRMNKEFPLWTYDKHVRDDMPSRTDQGKLPHYKTHLSTLYGEQGGNCAGCKTHFLKQHLHVDHIVAKSVGGGDEIENLQLLCGSCNAIKENRGMAYLITKLNM